MARSRKVGGKPATGKRRIEQYDHKGQQRKNNPPVGLVTEATDRDAPKKRYAYDPHLDPTLTWAGKAEHTSFDVPTVSLHVHERVDPKTIMEAVRRRNGTPAPVQGSLFESAEENPPLREAIDFYQHAHAWSNRLVAGDSLLVMNSLLEKEGVAGKVQMVYIDPPYGIRYGSNFQPFVNKRDVKDGSDEDLTQEPEMIRAFRDTWELGIHSYLSYLRDRLLLARELLHESGSCFVQIGDENVHRVQIDEPLVSVGASAELRLHCLVCQGPRTDQVSAPLLGARHFRRPGIPFRRRCPVGGRLSAAVRRRVSNVAGQRPRLSTSTSHVFGLYSNVHVCVRVPWGHVQAVRQQELENDAGRCSQAHRERSPLPSFEKPVRQAVSRDFPYVQLESCWIDQPAAEGKAYVVQTAAKFIQRCLLMATDPGDLVLDPTCGSGTTAYVAEQWGRRWITCDTSRVATTLAKQRLMTAVFDYYELAHPAEGVGSGFVYKTVPHVTLKSIANNEPPGQETLYDQPKVDGSRVRVTGPFTVEAVPAPTVRPLTDAGESQPADASVARSGETLRQAEWRAELLKTGIRGKNNQMILFSRVEPLAGTRWLHADAESFPNTRGADRVSERKPGAERVVISFGPEHAPLEQRQVELAWEEARTLSPRPGMLLFAAFQFDPEAAKDIDELTREKTGMTFLKIQMNPDLLTEDLKKKRASNESFWLMGQPDVEVRSVAKGEPKGKLQVEVHGFDYYNTRTGRIESGNTRRIALWMLDTDYDGRSLFPRQVFFPMADESGGWARLARNLKAEIDAERIESYRGTVSLPFEPGAHKRVAVKIVDDRGIESLKIIPVP